MSSNPITSVAPSSSPITSVSAQRPAPALGNNNNPQHFTRLNLELRGQLFPVDRETLMLLPESVLLGLFPQGLVLSKPATWEGGDDGVFAVDFDPECFSYILSFWSKAQHHFYGTPTTPGLFHAQKSLIEASLQSPTSNSTSSSPINPNPSSSASEPTQNPLLTKQAIIVLREELEYFSITTPGALAGTDKNGMGNEELREMKRSCGRALEDRKTIFAALQRNVNKENNLAEQHLIDMLCMSGFDRSDEWGYRACEPNRNIISSMALVLLKTGIHHPQQGQLGDDGKQMVPSVDAAQMATAQKLLLFWRKPARKCWWDGVEVEVPESSTSKKTMKVKVWARRVWTLELSLI